MQHCFLKQTNKEVFLGDIITIKSAYYINDLKAGNRSQKIILSESNLSELVQKGIVYIEDMPKIPTNCNYYFEKIAKKWNTDTDIVIDVLSVVSSTFPMSAFSILLKEIALEIDKKYNDHISNSNEIYVVSVLDGCIHRVNKEHIKTYKNFSAFRSVEDAELACSILKPFLDLLFGNEKRK